MVAFPGDLNMDSRLSNSEQLERFRPYLQFLVRAETDRRYAGKIDGSGIVQQSLLEAASDPTVPCEDAERTRAFLRRIVANNLADEIRKLRTQKRDIGREYSLDNSLEDSSCRLQRLLVAGGPSPSAEFIQGEKLLRLASHLELLPADQRRAIELHHLQELKLTEVARLMNRTRGSVASLIFRGLGRLRDQMNSTEEE